MDNQLFVEWGFKCAAGILLTLGLSEVRRIRGSIEKLNLQVATVLERTSWHQKALEKHDQKLSDIERRLFKNPVKK